MEKISLRSWQKFLVASLIVGGVSLLWNIILVKTTFVLAWVNFIEKIFFFIIIGLILSFLNPKILRILKFRDVLIIGFLIALIPTILEIISGALYPSLFLSSFIIRMLGAFLGLILTNIIYHRFLWER